MALTSVLKALRPIAVALGLLAATSAIAGQKKCSDHCRQLDRVQGLNELLSTTDLDLLLRCTEERVQNPRQAGPYTELDQLAQAVGKAAADRSHLRMQIRKQRALSYMRKNFPRYYHRKGHNYLNSHWMKYYLYTERMRRVRTERERMEWLDYYLAEGLLDWN